MSPNSARILSSARICAGGVALAAVLLGGSAGAQPVANIGFKSVGRAAPIAVTIPAPTSEDIEAYPPAEVVGLPEKYWMVGPFRTFTPGPTSPPRGVRPFSRPRPA